MSQRNSSKRWKIYSRSDAVSMRLQLRQWFIQWLHLNLIIAMQFSIYGPPESTLKYFTRVQNLSACFISQHGKYEHIIPVLKQYHWLPIRQRIHYKVLMLTFMSLNGLAPTYLEELMKRRPMKRTRADGNNDLVIPTIKHKSFGGRSVGYGD